MRERELIQIQNDWHKKGRWRKRACTWLNSLEWLVIIQEWMKDIPIKPNTAQYFAWVHFSNVYYFSFPFLFFSFEIDCEEAVFVCCELNSWNVNQIVSLMRIHIQTFSANVYTTHSARTHLPTRMCIYMLMYCAFNVAFIRSRVCVLHILTYFEKKKRKKTPPMYWHQQTFMCWPRYERRNRPTEVFNRFIFANFHRFKGCVSAKKSEILFFLWNLNETQTVC